MASKHLWRKAVRAYVVGEDQSMDIDGSSLYVKKASHVCLTLQETDVASMYGVYVWIIASQGIL